jgi:hypothetical protein
VSAFHSGRSLFGPLYASTMLMCSTCRQAAKEQGAQQTDRVSRQGRVGKHQQQQSKSGSNSDGSRRRGGSRQAATGAVNAAVAGDARQQQEQQQRSNTEVSRGSIARSSGTPAAVQARHSGIHAARAAAIHRHLAPFLVPPLLPLLLPAPFTTSLFLSTDAPCAP